MNNKADIHQSINNIRRLIISQWCNTHKNAVEPFIRGSLWEYSKLTGNEFETTENPDKNNIPEAEEIFSFLSWNMEDQWTGRISLVAHVQYGGSCVELRHDNHSTGFIDSVTTTKTSLRRAVSVDDGFVKDALVICCGKTMTPIHLLKDDLGAFFRHLSEFCSRYRVPVVAGFQPSLARNEGFVWREEEDLFGSGLDGLECLSPMSWDFGDRSAFFYHDFKTKINLDDIFAQTRDGTLGSEHVLEILMKLRGLRSPREISSDDPAIGELLLLDENRLKDYLKNVAPSQMDVLLGYVGIEIHPACEDWKEVDGLPARVRGSSDDHSLLVNLKENASALDRVVSVETLEDGRV